MQNVRISPSEYQQIIELVQGYLQYPATEKALTLFGYPLKNVSDGYILWVACEFCHQVRCRCGAPVEWQGRYLEQRAEGEGVLSAILKSIKS
jgi:hypothetical protein